MKHRVDIRGSLVPNDYKWYYDWFEMDSTCPNDVKKITDNLKPGDEVEVYINSPGGVIDVGSEIYTILRETENVRIYITGEACSAASVVAMAGTCMMSPTALMMVHCVSTCAAGNHNEMEHMAGVLRTADEALCSAYVAKSGMSREEALSMMEHETYLTAEQAKEKGLIDGIMFEENKAQALVAGPLFVLPSKEQMEKAKHMVKESEISQEVSDLLIQLNLLKLKGEKR